MLNMEVLIASIICKAICIRPSVGLKSQMHNIIDHKFYMDILEGQSKDFYHPLEYVRTFKQRTFAQQVERIRNLAGLRI